MSLPKPKVEFELDPHDDLYLYGVMELQQRGLIPIGESVLRRLIQDGDWSCGKLANRYVCTGKQHYENVLRHTGRAAEVVA